MEMRMQREREMGRWSEKDRIFGFVPIPECNIEQLDDGVDTFRILITVQSSVNE